MTVDCSFCSVPNCKSRGLTSGPTECIFVHKDSQTVAKMNYTTVSKIEEMAHRDLPVKSLVVGGVMFDENEVKRIGYILGAKAMLEEIGKVIDTSKFYSDMSTKTRLYEDLVNKIGELKNK